MTDRQRLLVALLSDAASTESDLENVRLLELIGMVDLAGQGPVRTR